MATAITNSVSPGTRPTESQVRTQVDAILASAQFQGSRRGRQFLQYVCERALAGESSSLKERSIAVDVFGRRPESDLGEDTIVRVGARELRKRLAQYYSSPDGLVALVRIDLPSGSYVPDFRFASEAQPVGHVSGPTAVVQEEVDVAVVRLAPPAGRLFRAGYLLVAAACLTAAIGLAVFFYWRPVKPAGGTAQGAAAVRAPGSFGRFWGPMLQSPDSALIAVGHPLVYRPSHRAVKLSESRLPKLPFPLQRPIQLQPQEMNGSDIVPVPNQFVGFGDLVVATEIAGMLGQHGKEFQVRMASGVSFAELRKRQVLLIGAMSNRWTMELGQNWRFRFDRKLGQSNVIVDTGSPTPLEWSVAMRSDDVIPEDYLLISRIANSNTGGLVIVGAGIKQFGTEAAGHLISDPAALNQLLDSIPAQWENKNLQAVLRVKVIANTPAQPELVAWQGW
jgi:hypothetical protein